MINLDNKKKESNTLRIEKYKPIIKKKKKKLDKTVLLGKIKLNTTEVVSL